MTYTVVYYVHMEEHPVQQRTTLPSEDVRLGVVRGISYGLFGAPDVFVPQARDLGARILRAYFFWSQIEPEPGRYTFDAVDALLQQLDGEGDADQELWITLCSSSPWATRTPTDFLPPSPAHRLDEYANFVRQIVQHCAGRVAYWQCDNEPSNTELLWAGTADEYVAQLRAVSAAVRAVDPHASVVLGGCGYDMLSSPPDSEQRRFFEHVVEAASEAFDIFDLHLYGDAYHIPGYVETARDLLRRHGSLKPIVAGEYGGPSLFEFPEVEAALQSAMAEAFRAPPSAQSTQALAAQTQQDTPERTAMRALYARMAELPPRLQMFMHGCPPQLEAKRHRIACRQTVVRNVLALANGIRRTLYWNLGPEVPGVVDPYMLMHLLVGKLPLMDYRGDRLADRHPEATTFQLLARQLHDVETITRVQLADQPSVYAFRVECAGRAPAAVVWERRDAFDGECQPTTRLSIEWPNARARAVDAFGAPHELERRGGQLSMEVSDTPVFVFTD